MITLITRAGCSRCAMVKRLLENYGVTFTEKAFTDDLSERVVREHVLDADGYAMLPIMEIDGKWFMPRDERVLRKILFQHGLIKELQL